MNNSSGSIQSYRLSSNNVICDVCGKKRKREETVLSFGTGDIPVIVACRDGCADYRHPLNSPPPVINDGIPVRNARPESKDTYISITIPSFMTWGHLISNGPWGSLNDKNSEFNLNTAWTWGNFKRP